MAKLSQDDIKNVKGQGFLINRGTEMFSGRVLPGNGVFTAKEMMKIAECAEKIRQRQNHYDQPSGSGTARHPF